ncbi:ribonuclease Z [Ophiocordyceps sinensis CO18]|nr:ribonuclease Z [Ophiocordyceps sinensis CO18]
MRAKSSANDPMGQAAVSNLPRARKDEEDMDEDERLLASEEGKKLSSKERRQLRNKVSARAFRSRRKEYITQLESEIATKVNENGDLRARQRALEEENRQLSELTRMLLGSPSFSTLLENLSTNPAAPTQAPQVKIEPQLQAQEMGHMRKDVNPHSGQHLQQQQIGMAIVPEQSMDFSMLSLDSGAAYNFQPQVFVVDTPEMPAAIDASILSGKARDLVEETFVSDEDSKVEVPAIERPAESSDVSESVDESPVDDEFERDPEFALFHSEPASARHEQRAIDADSLDSTDMFGGIETEKMLSRYELVDGSEDNMSAALAMARVQRISATMESVVSRLELLTMDL